MTFNDIDDEGNTWQEAEMKRLEAKVSKLSEENRELKYQLKERNYDSTYRENKMLKAELQNMFILEDENKDLKEELQRYKSITHDERMKSFKEENESMKVRIGQLLEKVHALESNARSTEATATEEQLKHLEQVMDPKNPYITSEKPLERPSTAQPKATDTYDPLMSELEQELDLDIQQMLDRNKKQLTDLYSEMEEVKNMRPPRKKKVIH